MRLATLATLAALAALTTACGSVAPRPEAPTAPSDPIPPEIAALPILLDPTTPEAQALRATHPTIATTARAGFTIAPRDDTGAWDLAESLLGYSALPQPGQLRTESFVAPFDFPGDVVESIDAGAGYRFAADLAPSPLRPGLHLLRVTALAPPAAPPAPARLAVIVDGITALDPATLAAALAPHPAATLIAAEETPRPLAPAAPGPIDRPADWPAALAAAALAPGDRLVIVTTGHHAPLTFAAPRCVVTTVIGVIDPDPYGIAADDPEACISVPGHAVGHPFLSSLTAIAAPLGAALRVIRPGHLPAALAAAAAPPAALHDARLTLRFDPRRVARWRLIGHDDPAPGRHAEPGRVVPGEPPHGATLRHGGHATALVEVALIDRAGPLGEVTLRGTDCAGAPVTLAAPIAPAAAPRPSLAPVALAAAVAEKLAHNPHARHLTWPALLEHAWVLPPGRYGRTLYRLMNEAILIERASAPRPPAAPEALPVLAP